MVISAILAISNRKTMHCLFYLEFVVVAIYLIAAISYDSLIAAGAILFYGAAMCGAIYLFSKKHNLFFDSTETHDYGISPKRWFGPFILGSVMLIFLSYLLLFNDAIQPLPTVITVTSEMDALTNSEMLFVFLLFILVLSSLLLAFFNFKKELKLDDLSVHSNLEGR